MVLEDLEAGFSQSLAMLLQAGQDTKVVRYRIAAELGGIGGAGSLFFGCALKQSPGLLGFLLLRSGERLRRKKRNDEERRIEFSMHLLHPVFPSHLR